MIGIILVVFMIILYTLQSLFCKVYSDNYPGDGSRATSVFCIVSGLIAAFATFCVSGFEFAPSLTTVILALVNCASLIVYNFTLIKASGSGPYSVTMTANLSGMLVIPTIVSIFFGEEVSWLKWLALGLTTVAICLVSRKNNEDKMNARIFIPSCIGLFIANGTYSALFDMQQRMTGPEEKEEMIIITYLAMTVISVISALAVRRKRFAADFRQTKKSFTFLVLCSLVVAAAINVLVLALPFINVTVLYTFEGAGVLLLSVLSSCVLFKEKLSFTNIVGCILMCAGLVCVAIG